MKKLVITLFIALLSFSIQGQEGQVWHTDIDKAIAISTKEQKPMFLFFTGSDWCGWCIRLQKEVFKTPEFTSWAKEKVVLVELDFPRRTPQDPEIQKRNANLQQIFGVQGYPTVWFAKPTIKNNTNDLEQLGSTGYLAGGPTAWIENANTIISKYVADTPLKSGKKDKKVKSKSIKA